MRQLPLGVQLAVTHRFETFHEGGNREAVLALVALVAEPGHGPLWLYGPPGCGRSHLLQAACARAGEYGLTAAWLPLAAARGADPAMLAGFERLGLVALDDVESVAGDAGWERALFTLWNELAEQHGRLVLAASAAPAAIPFGLRDLASRLASAQVRRLQPLAESEQAEALLRRARHRGLELPPETLGYLTRRAPRDFAALCRLLDELDTESLAAQRRLTVPFVRDWLGRGGA
ncbi:MAG: DnaA regulatory inactivator Hda [Steroidobacteraceae bacterium]|nr:DnaA regulatory inactivator Hda [Steroidobacteraceae bacterium]